MCQCDDTWIYVLMFAALAQHSPNEAEFLSQKLFHTNMEHLLEFFFFVVFSWLFTVESVIRLPVSSHTRTK